MIKGKAKLLKDDLVIQWPCDLPDDLKKQLLDCAVYRKGKEGLEVTQRLTPIPGVFYILKGSVGLCFSTPNMKNILGGITGKGDWIGAYGINNESPLFAVAEEVEPIEMLLFPKDAILKLAETEPLVHKWLFSCGQIGQQIWMQALLSSIHDKEEKVSYSLLELAIRQNTLDGALVCINVSQHQLSTITGISRPRLNEVLKRLESEGLISLLRGKVYINDIGALSKKLHVMNLMLKDPRLQVDASL